jgi:hypothetical protein
MSKEVQQAQSSIEVQFQSLKPLIRAGLRCYCKTFFRPLDEESVFVHR